MRIALTVVGALLMLVGAVWCLQGLNVLPGSFMSGRIVWSFYGAMAVISGVALIAWVNRRMK